MNSNDEGNSELCVACGDSSPMFESAEDDFNEIFCSLLRNILLVSSKVWYPQLAAEN